MNSAKDWFNKFESTDELSCLVKTVQERHILEIQIDALKEARNIARECHGSARDKIDDLIIRLEATS